MKQLHILQDIPPHLLHLLILPVLFIPIQHLLPLLIQPQYLLHIPPVDNASNLIRQHPHTSTMNEPLNKLSKPKTMSITNIRYLLSHNHGLLRDPHVRGDVNRVVLWVEDEVAVFVNGKLVWLGLLISIELNLLLVPILCLLKRMLTISHHSRKIYPSHSTANWNQVVLPVYFLFVTIFEISLNWLGFRRQNVVLSDARWGQKVGTNVEVILCFW